MKNFQKRWQNFGLEEKNLYFLSFKEKAKVYNYSFRDGKIIIPLREKKLLVSFSRSKEENIEAIGMLRWIKKNIFDPSKDQMAPVSFLSFEKFVQEQEQYFFELHPTVWSREDHFVRAQGWGKKEFRNAKVTVFYPKRDKDRILKTWRSYDSQSVITGNIVDEWTGKQDGSRNFAIVEGSQFCVLENSPKPSYSKQEGPLLQPEEAGYKVGKIFAGEEGGVGALYLAEEIAPETELL